MISKLEELIDTSHSQYAELVCDVGHAWEVLPRLESFFLKNQSYEIRGEIMPGGYIGKQVAIGDGTLVEPGAVILGPAIIGKNCRIRSGAYIRNHVVMEDDCDIGHASEIKHSFLFRGCRVAHFNYVGDSVLGNGAHLAAGAILSNVKIVGGTVRVQTETGPMDTGLKKFGSILGDRAEIGCNAVLNPGSIIGGNSIIYPLVNWRGVLGNDMIAKSSKQVVKRAQNSGVEYAGSTHDSGSCRPGSIPGTPI